MKFGDKYEKIKKSAYLKLTERYKKFKEIQDELEGEGTKIVDQDKTYQKTGKILDQKPKKERITFTV